MRKSSILSALTIALAAPIALAEVVTYTITQAQSSLTAQGDLAGATSSAQTAGSNTTTYSGTIQADRMGSTIQFLDGSSIQAANTGSYQPASGGLPGSASANYGLQSTTQFGTARAAVRDLRLDLSSGVINITGGAFPNDFSTVADDGVIDWNTGLSFDQEDLFGRSSSNSAAMMSSVSTVGLIETLTLQFNISYGYSTLTSDDSNLNLVGTIVATRVIPEPGVLFVAGMMLLTLRRRG